MSKDFQNERGTTTKTRWWRRLSVLLIAGGLLLASTPLIQKGYAAWSQSQLEQRFAVAAEAESSSGEEPSPDLGAETLPLTNDRWNNAVDSMREFQENLTTANWLNWRFAEDPALTPTEASDEGPTGAPTEKRSENVPPLARIKLPSIGVEAIVLQGTGLATLAKGPGFYQEGSLPGDPGNVAIAGHRTTYGAWFRHVDRLQDGDIIEVDYESVTYRYRVERVWVIESNDWSVIAPTEAPSLTLTTCHPPGSTAFRLAVRATLFETVS